MHYYKLFHILEFLLFLLFSIIILGSNFQALLGFRVYVTSDTFVIGEKKEQLCTLMTNIFREGPAMYSHLSLHHFDVL